MTVPTVPFYPITHDDGLSIVSALNRLVDANDSSLLLADSFDATASYNVGDYVIYSGALYRFTSAHSSESWNNSHVVQVSVEDELKNKVSKSGDTMSANYNLKRGDADVSTVKSSYLMRNINWVDKNDAQMAVISGGQAPNDQTVLSFTAINDNIQNYLYILAKRDGTRNVAIEPNSVVPWRNALGASSGIWPTSIGGTGGNDSGWVTISNASVFKDSNKNIQFRRVGCFVFMRTGGLLLKDNLTDQTIDLLTVPDQFLPINTVYYAVPGISKNNSFIVVDPSSNKKNIRFNKGTNTSWNNDEYIAFSIMYLAN